MIGQVRPGVSRLSALAWLMAGVGILLRVRQFAAERPLWLDESMIALNVLTRTYRGLLVPLDFDQTAPFPFLWGVKLSAALFGVHEWAIRLLPFLAGLALVCLFIPLAWRVVEPRAALLATGIVTVSPILIYYSNELKPYGMDAAWMTLLALLTLRVLARPGSHQAWAALTVVMLAAGTAVSPFPFCLAGVSACLVWDHQARTARPARLWLPVLVVGSAAVYFLVYQALYYPVTQNLFMQRFWTSYYLDPAAPQFWDRARVAFGTGFRDTFLAEGGPWRAKVAFVFLAPLVVGAIRVRTQRGTAVLLLCLTPWLAALAASVLGKYPFAPRLMLFSAPLVILLLAAGVGAMAEWLARRQPKIPWLAFAGLALAVTPVLDNARQIREPFAREAIGALIPWVVQTHAPGSAIYIPGRTVHSWLFYTTDWQAPDTARIARTCRLVCFGGPAFYLAPTRGDSIVAEGDAYHYRYHDWDELIGIPPGFGPDDKSVKRSVPDPGWEANEVRRMLDVSSSELWLVSSTYYPGYLDPLAAPLERAGAIVLERRIAPGASATRYRLPEGREAATVSRGN